MNRHQYLRGTQTLAVVDIAKLIVPPGATAVPVGLADWFGALNKTSVGRITTTAAAMGAWGRRVAPIALAARFKAAGLKPPHDYVVAFRVAHVGFLLHHGATVAEVCDLGQLDRKHIYEILHRVWRTGNLLERMRVVEPLWGARQFVVPMMYAVPAPTWTWPHLLRREAR